MQTPARVRVIITLAIPVTHYALVLHMQVTWEVVQRSTDGASSGPAQRGVYVGIQQMEYGNLAAPHLHFMSPFSGT